MSALVKPQPPPKPHSLTKSGNSIQRRNGAVKQKQIVHDKTIEDLVLDELYYDIVRNLPADDVAILMDEQKLLTSRQRDHYRMMKANHQPDVEKSEYLIDCLRKGEPGFLQRLCTILKELPPSSYLADKIQDKVKDMSSKPLILKTQCPESASKIKSDLQWKIEYRKLEMKTRMQLQAKDREIKRLRKVVRHLQKDNSDHLEQIFSEMKSQVENVAKWIDLKSKALLPYSNSLLRIALSREGKHGDLYSSHESQLSSSDVSSNQSTLERRHQRRESLDSYQPLSTCPPSSCESSHVATPTTPVKGRSYVDGDPDLHNNMLFKNLINPPTFMEKSDMLYITRLLRRESEAILNQLELQPDLSDSIKPPETDESKDEPDESVSHNQSRYDFSDWRSTLATTSVRARARSMSAPFVGTAESSGLGLSTVSGTNDANTEAVVTESDDLHTPSTVKSNTTSPKSSTQESPTQPKFKYRNKAAVVQQEQKPMADLIAVFRRIQGREFVT